MKYLVNVGKTAYIVDDVATVSYADERVILRRADKVILGYFILNKGDYITLVDDDPQANLVPEDAAGYDAH